MFVYCEFSRQGQWTWGAWNLIYLTPTPSVFPLVWVFLSLVLCVAPLHLPKELAGCCAHRWKFRWMLFKCYLSKTENFGAGFYACFQFKWRLMRVPARARFVCHVFACQCLHFSRNLRILLLIFYLRDLRRGCRRARRYRSFKRTQLYGDRYMASVFLTCKLASLLWITLRLLRNKWSATRRWAVKRQCIERFFYTTACVRSY